MEHDPGGQFCTTMAKTTFTRSSRYSSLAALTRRPETREFTACAAPQKKVTKGLSCCCSNTAPTLASMSRKRFDGTALRCREWNATIAELLVGRSTSANIRTDMAIS